MLQWNQIFAGKFSKSNNQLSVQTWRVIYFVRFLYYIKWDELTRYVVPPNDQGISNTQTLGGIEFILFSAVQCGSWATDRLNLYKMRLKPRQIESWFVALGLLEQRQITSDDEFDSYLQNILKDGSILCRLVNRVKPGTINKVREWLVYQPQRDLFRHFVM